jgi:hypothetical protein
MNIYEIISEAPEATTPGGIVIPAGAKTAAPKPGPSMPANAGPTISAPRQAVRKVTSVYDALGKSKAAKITGNFAKFLTPSTVTIKGQQIALENLPKVVQIAGTVSALLKFLSLMPFVWGYYGKYVIIDNMVTSGELDKEDREPALRLLAEETIANLLAGGVILKMAKWLMALVTGGGWAIRLISAGAGGTAALATGGVSIAAAVASIAATTAATVVINTWLQSESGQEMMAKLIMGIIDPALVAVYNVSLGTIFGKMKELSKEGEAPVEKALSSSPTLKGTIAGKPEVNQNVQQGAKPDASADGDTELEKVYKKYSEPKSMFDPKNGALLPQSK